MESEWSESNTTCISNHEFEIKDDISYAVCTCSEIGIVVAIGNETRDGWDPNAGRKPPSKVAKGITKIAE